MSVHDSRERFTRRSLSPEHRRQLEDGSAISPEVIAERGVYTVRKPRELPPCFSARQRRRGPGMLFRIHRPNGETSWSFRPDAPDPDAPGRKYEQPPKSRGGGNVLDVHPFAQRWIRDASAPVVFVEGIKKTDSVLSAFMAAGDRALPVALSGVYNWRSSEGPIEDLEALPLEGRRVTVMFDSDMLTNPNVQEACRRLAEYCRGRGAQVFVTYLRDLPDGGKCGPDDFFAAGGTLGELRLLTRPYDPADFVKVRMSRDGRLGRAARLLERLAGEMPRRRMGECTRASVMRVLVEEFAHSGKLEGSRAYVRLDRRTIAERAACSLDAATRAVKKLEETQDLDFTYDKTRPDRAGVFSLFPRVFPEQMRTELDKNRKSDGCGEERGNPEFAGVLYAAVRVGHGGVPELRWSKVIHTWARRDGRRVVVDSYYVRRLGKKRGAILAALVAAGGELSVSELAEAFATERTSLRHFVRDTIEPLCGRRYDKKEARWVEYGPRSICEIAGDVLTLRPDWREALEAHREEAEEIADARRQREKHARQRGAYRNRDRTPAGEPGGLQGKEKVRRMVSRIREREREAFIEEERRKVGMTATVFLADELEGVSGVLWSAARQRWAERGGDTEYLRHAVRHGPFRFRREEDGELYVVHAGASNRAPERDVERLVHQGMSAKWARAEVLGDDPPSAQAGSGTSGDWYDHRLDCECDECSCTPVSYVRYAS